MRKSEYYYAFYYQMPFGNGQFPTQTRQCHGRRAKTMPMLQGVETKHRNDNEADSYNFVSATAAPIWYFLPSWVWGQEAHSSTLG